MTSPSTIAARVAEMHAAAATPSGEETTPFRREQAMLARGLPPGVAAAGTIVPDTELVDPFGVATTLYAATGH